MKCYTFYTQQSAAMAVKTFWEKQGCETELKDMGGFYTLMVELEEQKQSKNNLLENNLDMLLEKLK